MTELLVGEDEERLMEEGITATLYDMTMGTSQMLGCMEDRLSEIDPDADITTYGQELNDQTFAIAKADTLIKGGNADNMRQGDTLADDKFEGYKFDYIISNPPFGIEWKTSKAAVEAEYKKGAAGRFEPGLPAIGDGQQLFLLNGVAKLKDTGRMAIIQNGSPLFKGDAMTYSTTRVLPLTFGLSPAINLLNVGARCSLSMLASVMRSAVSLLAISVWR